MKTTSPGKGIFSLNHQVCSLPHNLRNYCSKLIIANSYKRRKLGRAFEPNNNEMNNIFQSERKVKERNKRKKERKSHGCVDNSKDFLHV